MSSRWLVVLLGAVAAVALFFVLRPEGDGESGTTATSQPPPPPTPNTATTEPEPPPPPPPPPGPPPPATLRVNFRDGAPVGGIRRATVAKGRRIRLVVTSDVPDHVHVHGYDIFRDVAPGAPARLGFRATLPGRFEVELEDRGLQLVDLRVNP